jgi:phosphoglycerate dehydrogenase-like enzyme
MESPINTLILLSEPFTEPQLSELRVLSPRVMVEQRIVQRGETVAPEAWAEVEVLYSARHLPEAGQAPNLRWVQAHFAGVNRWLGHPALQGVTLTTASGVHAVRMGEYVTQMLLAFAHQMPRLWRAQAAREWAKDWANDAFRELRGATLAVVGYGSIGREAARQARALGMRVLASKRDPTRTADPGWSVPGTGDPRGELPERFYGPADWHAMLAEADYVLVSAPLTPGTKHLMDHAALKAMRPGAVLINVARGDLVDEAALIEELTNGRLGGAALDVFAQEPLPAESPLWTLPNVILTPHIAGLTPAYNERALALFAENLRRYAAGDSLLNAVDQTAGY